VTSIAESAQKIVFITGSTSGIGYALARTYLSRGYVVWVSGPSRQRLASSLDNLKKEYIGTIHAVVCDVTSDSQVADAIQTIVQTSGRLDVVILNAGYCMYSPIADLSIADIAYQFDINLYGAIRVVNHSLSEIIKTKGQYITVGSLAGYLGLGERAAYSMSKAALRVYSESFNCEWRSRGIAMTYVSPGYVATPTRLRDKMGKIQSADDGKSSNSDSIPKQFLQSPDLTAKLIFKAARKRREEILLTPMGYLVKFAPRRLVLFLLKILKLR